ncbi:MAG TPA: hypothetical protein VGB04_06410 [Allosphingosinicella sp.]
MAKPPEMVRWINDHSDSWDRRYESLDSKGGFLAGAWVVLMWGVHKLHRGTAAIEDEGVKAGLRFGLSFCIAAISIVLILSLIYIAIGIALIAAGIWVVGRVLEDEDSARKRRAREREARLEEAQDHAFAHQKGRSRRRTDRSGKEFTEHLRDDGTVASRSEIKKDWLGNSYVETRNSDGDVVETAEVRRGLMGGLFVEHRNGEGDETGRSRDQTGWFGDEYVEHKDAEGNETGRSRGRTDRHGNDYTEHERRD